MERDTEEESELLAATSTPAPGTVAGCGDVLASVYLSARFKGLDRRS